MHTNKDHGGKGSCGTDSKKPMTGSCSTGGSTKPAAGSCGTGMPQQTTGSCGNKDKKGSCGS